MKLQIDTAAKTIKLESSENLDELFTLLEKMLPNGEWKSFKLETNTVINWQSAPTIIYRDRYPLNQPWQSPFWYGTVQCDGNSYSGQSMSNFTLKADVPFTLTNGQETNIFNVQTN